MPTKYTGVWEGLTDIQVALLRAQYIFDVSDNEYAEDLAASLFDLGLVCGWHPDHFSKDDLQDELVWMEETARQYAIDTTTEECGSNEEED